jgi:RpiR family carbohydrate utilization transcriptional regulator
LRRPKERLNGPRAKLEQIQNRLEELNKAERKVAEVILLNPQQATRFSIAALAQAASVSEPTVNRFCRSFGVSGYPELKLQLAQSLASGAAYVSRAVEADDNPRPTRRRSLAVPSPPSTPPARPWTRPDQQGRGSVDPGAADPLLRPRRFGPGGHGRAAQVFPFQPVGDRPCRRADATHDGSVAHTGELFVIISYTGRTRELVEVARIARKTAPRYWA